MKRRCLDVPLPRRRLHGCDHRLHAVAQALPADGLVADRAGPSRVINVDGDASYPPAIAELKESGELGRRCKRRPCPYLNNLLKQRPSFS